MQAARDRMADLWVAHKPAVEAFVRARAAADRVDDVVAQTFTVAWQRLDDVPDDARPWLFGVARHLLLHEARTAARRAALVVRAQPLAQTTPGAEETALTRIALVRAWSRLTDQQRDTLALVAWDGLSAAQAAQVEGVSRVAFSVRLLRARRALTDLVTSQDVQTDVPTIRLGAAVPGRTGPSTSDPAALPASALRSVRSR